MAGYIESSVQRMLDSASTERVTLLVGYEAPEDEIKADINRLDGEVLDEVGRSTLRVTIPEKKIADLSDHSGILSIEPDNNDVRQQNSGNSHPPTSMM